MLEPLSLIISSLRKSTLCCDIHCDNLCVLKVWNIPVILNIIYHLSQCEFVNQELSLNQESHFKHMLKPNIQWAPILKEMFLVCDHTPTCAHLWRAYNTIIHGVTVLLQCCAVCTVQHSWTFLCILSVNRFKLTLVYRTAFGGIWRLGVILLLSVFMDWM